MLDAGGIDIAMIESRRVRPQWKQVQVGREEMVLCVAPGHPLAKRKSIAGSELDGLPMALFNGTLHPARDPGKALQARRREARGGAAIEFGRRSSGARWPTAWAPRRCCARSLRERRRLVAGLVRAEGDPALLAVLARRELPVEGEPRAGRLRGQDRKDQMTKQGGSMQIATHWRAALAVLALFAASRRTRRVSRAPDHPDRAIPARRRHRPVGASHHAVHREVSRQRREDRRHQQGRRRRRHRRRRDRASPSPTATRSAS